MLDTSEKIKIIQKLSGQTQAELALELGVTFAALNRWFNKKASPRQNMLKKIDKLFRHYTGQIEIPNDKLSAKKAILLTKKSMYKNIALLIFKRIDLYKEFQLQLTYNTNKIEGSSLTIKDTAAVLFDHYAIPNKTLIEHLEVKNHQSALNYIFGLFQTNTLHINEAFILKLHSILMHGIQDDAGFYRRHGVRILGSNIVTANYLKVPTLITELLQSIQQKETDFVAQATRIHCLFEKIHPFSDGNGRIGRLLLNTMLLAADYCPAIIAQKKKQQYYTFLAKAQNEEKYSQIEDYICDAILDGYKLLV